MKTWQIVLFGAVMLLFLWFPYNMIRQSRFILKNGDPYRFLLQPIDPYDVFRGSYVTLNYNRNLVPAQDSFYTYQDVYLSITTDTAGFAYFEQAYQAPPENRPYLKAKVEYYSEGEIHVDIPENIRYYYLNEKTAPQVERALTRPRTSNDTENRVYVQVRIRKGEAVVEELYINDLTVREFFK
ncbi:MAG: GDYXXLXY domain-containing protein [Saprospiraceae bacterium]